MGKLKTNFAPQRRCDVCFLSPQLIGLIGFIDTIPQKLGQNREKSAVNQFSFIDFHWLPMTVARGCGNFAGKPITSPTTCGKSLPEGALLSQFQQKTCRWGFFAAFLSPAL